VATASPYFADLCCWVSARPCTNKSSTGSLVRGWNYFANLATSSTVRTFERQGLPGTKSKPEVILHSALLEFHEVQSQGFVATNSEALLLLLLLRSTDLASASTFVSAGLVAAPVER